MADIKKIIKDLQGNFAKDNEVQMKCVQLLKGIATSDEKISNEFMKKLDVAITKVSKEVLGETNKKKENIDLANKLILSEGTIVTIDKKDYQIEIGDQIVCEKELKEAMQAFAVYLGNKKIDTVFYDDDMSTEDIKTSLINHDGYNPAIKVIKER